MIVIFYWEIWFELLLLIGIIWFYIGGDGMNLFGNCLYFLMVGVSGCLFRYFFWKVRGFVGDCGFLFVVYVLFDLGSYISVVVDKLWE